MERDKDYLGIAPDGLSLTLERLPESNRPFNLLVSVWSNYIVRDTNGEPSISRPFANEFYIIHPRARERFHRTKGLSDFRFSWAVQSLLLTVYDRGVPCLGLPLGILDWDWPALLNSPGF